MVGRTDESDTGAMNQQEKTRRAALVGLLSALVGFNANARDAGSITHVAQSQIEVRSEVSGHIASINLVQDQEVKKGDLLMTIDPEPFQTAYDKAVSRLGKAQWRYLFARSGRTRALQRAASHPDTDGEMEAREAAVKEASDAVASAQAQVDEAKRNLELTKVTAPASGIVGHINVSVGSPIAGGQTDLTSVLPLAMDVAGNR